MSDTAHPYNIVLHRPPGGWGTAPHRVTAPAPHDGSSRSQHPQPQAHGHDRPHARAGIYTPVARQAPQRRAQKKAAAYAGAYEAAQESLTRRLAKKAAAELALIAPWAMVAAMMVPAHLNGQLAHAVSRIGIHPGVMSTSNYISKDTPDPVTVSSAAFVALGLDRQIPQGEAQSYFALRDWARTNDPASGSMGHALEQAYNFAALNKLNPEAMAAMPHFVGDVKANLVANRDTLASTHDKAALALLEEMSKLAPFYQQQFASAFNLPFGLSPEAQAPLRALFAEARQGRLSQTQLAAYKNERATIAHYYDKTRDFFDKAKQNGLLYCMGLAERVTGVALVQDQLTVSARESGLDMNKMWLRTAGQSAGGAEQLTDPMVANLVAEYRTKLLGMIDVYKAGHTHMSANDAAWLNLTEYQLKRGATAQQFKENYVLAFMLNHLSLDHDRTSLVNGLSAQFHLPEAGIERYITRPEQLSLINFAGLGTAQNMAAAYIRYQQNPRPGNDIRLSHFMSPAVLKRNHLSGRMGINKFFAEQIKPWNSTWVGFVTHLRHDVFGVALRGIRPSLPNPSPT